MQNAHIHLDVDKAIRPTIPFGGTVPRCACDVTEFSLLHTNHPPPFTLHIISNLFYKTGLTIVSVGLFCCARTRAVSALRRGLFLLHRVFLGACYVCQFVSIR